MILRTTPFMIVLYILVVTSAGAREWQIPANVAKVTDGDTVHVVAHPYPNMFLNDKVRILSLDTPEITHAKCKQEREAGLRAKARAQSLLDNKTVTLVLDGDRQRDNFGRLLAHLKLEDGRDFSQVMVQERLGRPTKTDDWCQHLN